MDRLWSCWRERCPYLTRILLSHALGPREEPGSFFSRITKGLLQRLAWPGLTSLALCPDCMQTTKHQILHQNHDLISLHVPPGRMPTSKMEQSHKKRLTSEVTGSSQTLGPCAGKTCLSVPSRAGLTAYGDGGLCSASAWPSPNCTWRGKRLSLMNESANASTGVVLSMCRTSRCFGQKASFLKRIGYEDLKGYSRSAWRH